MKSTKALASLATLSLSGQVAANVFTDASNNIALYWGQNSYGQGSGDLAQQSLATYCANTDVNIIPMAFLYQLTTGEGGQPVINFANSGNTCSTFSGTELLDCSSTIGPDITTCQQQYGKTILLSIGGATYTEGGFSSESQAQTVAQQIWATFGPEQSGSSALRPFGSASVDGFDFDFESTVQNVAPFAQELRDLMNADTSGTYYLTAAPQCPYPDAGDNAILNGGVPVDAVFVQFYNNYCGSQSYVSGTTTQNNFDFSTWDNWAKTGSANPNVKVFLGVPAGQTGAGSGYVAASDLTDEIQYSETFSSFGGVMMWDASQANANSGFIESVKSEMGSGAAAPGGPSTSKPTKKRRHHKKHPRDFSA